MKNSFLLCALAATLFAACSNDDSLNENQTNAYDLVEGQPAFISLGIAMPSSQVSRANDDFDDGDETEYAVKSGMLVLFKGANEADAVAFGTYSIDPKDAFSLENGSTQITSTSKKYVQEITAPSLSTGENLYAYVILNNTGNVNPSITVGSTKFSDFSMAVFKAIGIADADAETKGYGKINSTNGLVMTNVPLATAGGGVAAPATGTGIFTLAKIDPSAIYDSKEAATAGSSAACIYVERAAVKVQVTMATGLADPTGNAGGVELLGWALGNTNNGGNSGSGYYNTRQFETAWMPYTNNQVLPANANIKYRFVCKDALFGSSSSHAVGYRTYFGKDVNYTFAPETTGSNGLVNGVVVADDHKYVSNDIVYTYENTFDENSQIFGNTTYVSFKTKLNGGNDFYTIESARNTALTEENLKTALGTNIGNAKATEIDALTDAIASAISADLSDGSSKIIAADGEESSPLGITSASVINFELGHSVTLGSLSSANIQSYTDKLVFKSIKVNSVEVGEKVEAAINALKIDDVAISNKLANIFSGYAPDVVNKYVGGVTYYAVRIAHFGDTETPWNAANDSHDNYAKIYPLDGQAIGVTPADYGTGSTTGRANAWLGRWGIVRNNWYTINVTGVSGIGDATPVDYSGAATGTPGITPDDNPEPKYYIAAHIHILPWVKRTQNAVLK